MLRRSIFRLVVVSAALLMLADVAGGQEQPDKGRSGLALLHNQAALRQKAQNRSQGDAVAPQQLLRQLGAKGKADLQNRRKLVEPRAAGQAKKMADQFYNILLSHVLAYQVTGQEDFLHRAEELMLEVASWSRWNHIYEQPWKNSLDRDAILISVGLAYDVLRPQLSPGTRRAIADAILEKGIKPIRISMRGGHPTAPHWPFANIANTNHGAIGATAIGIGCLAIAEDLDVEPYLSAAIEAAGEFIQHSGGQDGGYPESVSYGCFALNRLQLFNDLLVLRRGVDLFERFDQKDWVRRFHEYILYAVYPDQSTLVPFNDESGRLGFVTQRLAQASSYYEGEEIGALCQAQLLRLQKNSSGVVPDVFDFLYYDPQRKTLPLSSLPRFKWFRDIGHAFYRESWESADGLYMAFKAEAHARDSFPVDPAHSQFDGGQFILVNNGIEYLLDPGYQIAPSFAIVAGSANAELNQFSKTSLGHNNMLFNGQPQDALASRITSAESNGDSFIIEMDLTASYPGSLQLTQYKRHFVYQAGNLVVADVFQGAALQDAAFRLLLTNVSRAGASLYEAQTEAHRYRILPAAARGSVQPLHGIMLTTGSSLSIQVVDRPLPRELQRRGGPSGYRYLEATLSPLADAPTILVNVLSFASPPDYALTKPDESFVIRNQQDSVAPAVTISEREGVQLQ